MNFASLAYDQTSGMPLMGRLYAVWELRVWVSKEVRGKTEGLSDIRRPAGHNDVTCIKLRFRRNKFVVCFVSSLQ